MATMTNIYRHWVSCVKREAHCLRFTLIVLTAQFYQHSIGSLLNIVYILTILSKMLL